MTLAAKCVPVSSSWVSLFILTCNNELAVQFHNGVCCLYPGTNANLYTVSPAAGNVVGGGSASSSAAYARPLLGGNTSANVALSTSAVRCAPLPAPLALNGT